MSIEEKREPVRVLELMCGLAKGRPAFAERFPKARIEYVGIDTNIESITPSNHPAIAETFHKEHLDIRYPDVFAAQLKRLLGEQSFDEIHFHMPLNEAFNDRDPRFLAAVAQYLKPGGRLYHMWEYDSPLFRHYLPRIGDVTNSGEAAKRNNAAIKEYASQVGLVPEKIGHRTRPGFWLTNAPSGKWATKIDVPRRALKALGRLDVAGERYSSWIYHAQHFAILRKPKLGK